MNTSTRLTVEVSKPRHGDNCWYSSRIKKEYMSDAGSCYIAIDNKRFEKPIDIIRYYISTFEEDLKDCKHEDFKAYLELIKLSKEY